LGANRIFDTLREALAAYKNEAGQALPPAPLI